VSAVHGLHVRLSIEKESRDLYIHAVFNVGNLPLFLYPITTSTATLTSLLFQWDRGMDGS
jgi:hypothetical protein